MQDTFARATHSAARPSARATIGYLVYNGNVCKSAYITGTKWPILRVIASLNAPFNKTNIFLIKQIFKFDSTITKNLLD